MSVTSVVDLAVGKIGELLIEEAKLLYGVEDQIEKLKSDLTMMSGFLKDMDEQAADERNRLTIKEIRRIAYDAEDVIESYILEASKKEDLVKRYVCPFLHAHEIGSKIEAIKARIDDTMVRWKRFGGENVLKADFKLGLNKREARISYSHTYEDVVGLKDDIEKLVGVLTTNEGAKIKVITIEGMGGSGKTTLARKLYQQRTVKKHFDCFAWVSVSQQWVTRQIILGLLKEVGKEIGRRDESLCTDNVLVEKLHRYLEGKRYLIVLDDVWEEKALEYILPAFPLRNDASRIIVTTRNKKVVCCPVLKPLTYPHEPRRLNEDESWELFRKIALIHREETINSIDVAKLEALGKEMLKKCRGLPLAVIALAGILIEKETPEEWDRISKAVSSRIMDDGKGTHLYGPVNEMLALSYIVLPPELKTCFLYLARYPEDHKISVGKLIRMWIAEGFFTTAKVHEGDTIEDVARWYLDKLVHRCLVQVESRGCAGKVKTIQIHDLVRDLCMRKAKEEDFLETFASKRSNTDAIRTKSRRAAIFSPKEFELPFPERSQHLRSLEYTLGESNRGEIIPSLEFIHKEFSLLRVLQLELVRTSTGSLPAGIGNLFHLKYLGLRNTNITELPSSIGNLRNLLTLECKAATWELELSIPDTLGKIEGLRHLYIYYRRTMCSETFRLHTLECLQTLKGISGGTWMLKELPRLSPSVRKLSMLDIRSQEQLEAAFQCPSVRRDSLHSLALCWRTGNNYQEEVKLKNLEPIIHSQLLRTLSLDGSMGLDGSGVQFPTSIKKLELWNSRFETEAMLVALGKLPQLTILKLGMKAYEGTKWTCTAGEFPQLKMLNLHNLVNLEEWSIEMGAMPQLNRLRVRDCKKLRKIPEGLKSITTLQD